MIGISDLKLTVMKNAFHALERHYLPKHTDGVDGRYGFVPYKIDDFIELLAEAWLLQPSGERKFLDVGAGIGTKVLLADVLFNSNGIEIDPFYVDMAHRLGVKVDEQNALEYQGYSDYDFIYFFVPIKDHELEQKLEYHIHSSMRPGSYVAPISAALNWDDFEDMEKQKGWYKKCQRNKS